MWSDQVVGFRDSITNELTSFTYDAAGRMATRGDGRTFVWNSNGTLAQITVDDNPHYVYQYDANNVLLACTDNINHKKHTYRYINGNLVNWATHIDNALLRSIEFVYNTMGIIGFYHNHKLYTYRKNLFGDITEIYDGSTCVAKYVYDAWGNHKVCNPDGTENFNELFIGNINPIRYRGYYYDIETGFYYLKSRYYSPELGRFISPDGVEYLEPDNLNGLNLYAYCGNNPVMYIDPNGHFPISLTILGLILGVGAGLGTAAYIDYKDDGQIFNGSVAWYDYLGAAVLGGAIGAGLGAFAGMSFSASFPTFGWMNTGGALMFGVTGTTTLTITGAEILGVAGLIGTKYMFASNNRPGNNRVQNKQFEQAARSAGYNPKDPRVRDILNEIHQYIRKNKLNLGWKELLQLIKEWLG